jgi:hypothetical protein
MLKRLTILAALVACTVFAFSAGASAATPTPVVPPEEVGSTAADPYTYPSGLVARSSHGYWLIVNSRKGHLVEVEASGAKGSVAYTVPGSISEAGIHANLGKYGRVDMRWVPSGKVSDDRVKCHYKGVRKHFYDAGSYVGTLEFRGGGGFTATHLRRITWRRSWYSDLSACGYSLSTGEPGAGVVINAGEPGHMSTPIHLSVYRPHAGAKVEYGAHSEATEGRVKISRRAYADGASRSLTLTAGNGVTTATIDPPAPFYGKATFEGPATLEHTNESKGTLTGELGVEFPDGTKFDLAGSKLEADLREESINIIPG